MSTTPVSLDVDLVNIMHTLAEHELPEDRRLGQGDGREFGDRRTD